jgi:hypothetical protein
MNNDGRNGDSRSKLHDDHVLWTVIGFCLVTPVALVTIWQFTGKYYPPMLHSILLGIAVAALTYRYLGGSHGSIFSVGVLKLAGSAALLIGTAYLANIGLEKQMDIGNSVQKLREAETKIVSLVADNSNLKETLETTKRDIEINLADIEKLTPDSVLGSQLAAMAKKCLGPFSDIARDLDVRVSVAGYVSKPGTFYACDDLKLRGESVRFLRVCDDQSLQQSLSVTGVQGGRIAKGHCNKSDRGFDLQIGCVDGQKLFPDHISGCDENRAVKWKLPAGPRIFSVSAEVLAEGYGKPN